MTETLYWRFDPLDTWFFREARGFETSGHNELSSLFPPPARTVAGALRTLIGEQQQVDWSRFPEADAYAELRALIGDGDSLGQLELTGPYPLWNGARLYPVPQHLLGKDGKYRFLEPGEPVTCDLGRVTLPQIRATADGPLLGAKPLEGGWLERADLQRVLAGKVPARVLFNDDLFDEEPRLGIARDNARRTGRDGLLYQTRHLRPRAGLAIGVGSRGLSADMLSTSDVIRFGGEARPSAVRLVAEQPVGPEPPVAQGNQLALMLLTPADFDREWLPPGFIPSERDGLGVWQGKIRGVSLTLRCAVIGKTAREGGWDLANQRPRPVRSLVPAGSIYFCTLDDGVDARAAVEALHGQHIGRDSALGRGELAVGLWPIEGDENA
ncbi:CRISPR-associated protein, Cmr3 family [Thiorhodococcus drewsii AZ1]|uniref:CRISPR-associated protein, Cmr3 family n=1 Tax=Thiorhodococcus drewsii AZ1 TaxID=765913 RepID=G2DYK6_9GAMM|nr:type III-B CRISPR module-associated protein Cmr3 [Thiorhodococcus drewsii]EGV32633.1 CRISPR-associated protein, Cmr3 family [Thiorhodococcus drewsii AZ1]